MAAKDAAKIIAAARTALILDQPFWGALVLRLKPVATQAVPMGATDGEHFYYNPDYIERISFEEVKGLAAEEVMHCAMGHIWRRGGRDHERFNIAADYALAGILKQAGFDTGDMLYDAQWEGRSAEWIYDRLPARQKGQGGAQAAGKGKGKASGGTPQGGQAGQESGQSGERGRCRVLDAPIGAPDDASEASWQQAVQQAALTSKQRGNLPAGAERFIQAATKPRVDWRSVLHRFVQQVAREDYSWKLPNSRYVARGLYMPRLYSESVGPIIVAVDTSGSIDGPMLDQFAAEIRAIVDEAHPERVHVIYCDAAVAGVETFERGEQIVKFNPKGGGGTAFEPAIDKAEELEDSPACMIYLTDLYGSHRDRAPEFPILWVSTTAGMTVPYGELVEVQ
jgi:predicted metal-dependent peptidase